MRCDSLFGRKRYLCPGNMQSQNGSNATDCAGLALVDQKTPAARAATCKRLTGRGKGLLVSCAQPPDGTH